MKSIGTVKKYLFVSVEATFDGMNLGLEPTWDAFSRCVLTSEEAFASQI